MSYQHQAFEQILGYLSEDEISALLSINAAEFATKRLPPEQSQAPKFRRALTSLECEGLLRRETDGWHCTWLGIGVANWTLQKLLAGDPEPHLPELGENGRTRSPYCGRFRPAHFAAGRCWCTRTRHEHIRRALL